MRIVILSYCLLVFSNTFAQKLYKALPVDQEGPSNSPLIRALVKGDLPHARRLIEAGMSPNGKDQFGSTPLGVAISMDIADFAGFLVQKGADVNIATDDKGTSPLMVAAWSCDLRVAKLLLEHGAKADRRTKDNETPLSFAAAACKNGEMIKLLIASGVPPNTKDKFGSTPLMAAASSRNVPAVRELLQAGADVTAKNERGETAEDRACGRGAKESAEICTFLRDASKK